MGHIKSALELALEKSEGITVDKGELRRKDLFNQGRTLGVKALTDGTDFLKEELIKLEKAYKPEEISAVRSGLAEALLGRIVLGIAADSQRELPRVTDLIASLTQGKSSSKMQKLVAMNQQFQEEIVQLKEAIAQQLGPALKQRAQQMARDTGAQVKFVLEKDPGYLKVLNQNLEPLKNQYSEAFEKLKNEIKSLI